MSDEVNAFVRSQIVVVEPSSGSVAVINAGPSGPSGPPGPPGSGGTGGGFPIDEDDGTSTFSIRTQVKQMVMDIVDDTTGDNAAVVEVGADQAALDAFVTMVATTLDSDALLQILALNAVPTYPAFKFRQNSRSILIGVGAGNPNGTISGLKGSLFFDATTPALYQNMDGATVWNRIGGLPITDSITLSDGSTFSVSIAKPVQLFANYAEWRLQALNSSNTSRQAMLRLMGDHTNPDPSPTILMDSANEFDDGARVTVNAAPHSPTVKVDTGVGDGSAGLHVEFASHPSPPYAQPECGIAITSPGAAPGGPYIELSRVGVGVTPSPANAQSARLFTRLVGTPTPNKMQLCVRFPTGAVQVIASEP